MIVRLLSGGTGKKFTLPEVNERINELLKHSIKSEGVINLFSDVKTEFSLFDPKFLEEIANMKEKNLAVELLKKLIDWQKKESARAGMRRLVKRLLKKHKYPPEGMDDAVQTVMSQCEMWRDNVMTV